MPSVASVRIHASQFPENVRRDLLASLRTRQVNHKFHYDSVKQTHQWLALHQAYSPARYDADCRAVYNQAFKAAAARAKVNAVHVIGLGCGGGQKDARLLKLLKARGQTIFYTPCDVSTSMVLVARRTALAVLPEKNCFPLVCDLATSDDLPTVLDSCVTHHAPARHSAQRDGGSRIITFFGMIPNFEPQIILPKLAALVRPKDFLLFSANLAPGKDYAAGLKKVLPQYDNPLTRDWLMTFLLDLGIGRRDGKLRFKFEAGAQGLKRIAAYFRFHRRCRITVENEAFDFRANETLRLFFSYRYTPERVSSVLAQYGLRVFDQWIAKSEEEGIFLCERT